MSRAANAPRASEMHWLSDAEKERILAKLNGESFSNYVRRSLFRLPALQHGGARKAKAKKEKV